MARQGCRNQRLTAALFLVFLGLFGSVDASLVIAEDRVPSGSNDNLPANALDYRLELTWSSETARLWAGRIVVTTKDALAAIPGRLSKPTNLTPGMLMCGGIHLNSTGDTLQFAPSPSTRYLQERSGKFVSQQTTHGGLIFRVRGIETDRIAFSFRREDENGLASPVAISLAELASGRSIENQLSDSASWRIKRVAGDRLRVTLTIPTVTPDNEEDRQGTSLFWDDQSADIRIQCDQVNNDSLELVCDTFTNDKRLVESKSWPVSVVSGQCSVNDSSWQPPRGDGTYDLRWQLRLRAGSRPTWTNALPNAFKDSLSIIRGTSENPIIAESTSRVVVLSRQRSTSNVPSFATVSRIDPFGGSWAANRFIPIRQATQLASIGVSPSKPKRVEMGGKALAELPPGGHWEHSIPIARIGEKHRLTITLPDAQAMRLGVCVVDRASATGKPSVIRDVTITRTRLKSGDSAWTTASIDFFPQTSAPQLFLINRDPRQTVSFEAVDVAVATTVQEQPLAVEPSSDTSAPVGRRALVHLESRQWLAWFGNLVTSSENQTPVFGDELTAAQRLVASLRQHGYSGVMMTVCEDGHSLYPSKLTTADASQNGTAPASDFDSPETLELLLRVFDREGMKFIPCVRANFPLTSLEKELIDNSEKSRGISPANPWSGFDLALGDVESMASTIYNPLHESVANTSQSVVEELLEQTIGHDCVDTIGLFADEGSFFRLPSRRATLDNATLDCFFESLPPGKMVRSQVVAWVHEDGESAFDEWREQRFENLSKRWTSPILATKKCLLVATSYDQVPSELLNLASSERISVSQLYRRGPLQSLAARSREESTSSFCGADANSLEADIVDSAFFIASSSSNTPCNGDRELLRTCGRNSDSEIVSWPLNDAVISSLVVSKLLSRCDRQLLVIGGCEAFSNNETRRRSILTFQRLPAGLMADVPATGKALKLVKLRRLDTETETYLAATNHCLWPMNLELSLPGARAIENVVPSGESPSSGAAGVWRVSLEAGELAAIRVPRLNTKSLDWSASMSVSPALVSEVGNTIRELAEVVAVHGEQLQSGSIENPSFEAEPPVAVVSQAVASAAPNSFAPLSTNVPGWLLSQHPVGCAVLDEEVAFDGKRSIRLSNRDGRPGGTWIVSRAVPPPASERIAMSLMVRGEPSEDPTKSKPIALRIAIEGAVAGSAMRQVVTASIPRNGKWSQVPLRVQVDSLPRTGVESLRLAVDVMNEGTVWIDNVKAEDSFLNDQERTQLQSQMFLALGGIAKGELGQASRLFELQWVQEMLSQPVAAFRPIAVNPEQATNESVVDNVDEVIVEEIPGIADRIKAWLPKPARF